MVFETFNSSSECEVWRTIAVENSIMLNPNISARAFHQRIRKTDFLIFKRNKSATRSVFFPKSYVFCLLFGLSFSMRCMSDMFAKALEFYRRSTRGENLSMLAHAAALSICWECVTSVVAASEAANRTSSDLFPLPPPV